ncbi:hypothetical protein KCX83_04170 [Brucella oryzae]|uniref:hypothetical protein n=1 Tax=Brucella oryzae TaxID=335286 RepID=UPI001B81C716|nr:MULTISPECIES: hypothetical protein [Brucella]MBR7651515.1 hypothetical protein [Brucella oryzae]
MNTIREITAHLADAADLVDAIITMADGVAVSPGSTPAATSAAASIAALARRIDGHLEALAEIEDRRQ